MLYIRQCQANTVKLLMGGPDERSVPDENHHAHRPSPIAHCPLPVAHYLLIAYCMLCPEEPRVKPSVESMAWWWEIRAQNDAVQLLACESPSPLDRISRNSPSRIHTGAALPFLPPTCPRCMAW